MLYEVITRDFDCDRSRALLSFGSQPDLHDSLFSELAGVAQQIHEDLFDLRLIGVDRSHAVTAVDVKAIAVLLRRWL